MSSRVLANADGSILVNANREPARGPDVAGGGGGAGPLSGYCTGVDGASMLPRVNAISTWMGVRPGCILINTGGQPSGATWNSVGNNAIFSTLAATLDGMGIMPIINIPIVPGSLSHQFVECARGDFDANIDALGQGIKDQGVTKVSFRIGHEANLRKSWPYSCDFDRAANYVNYKAAFNRVAQRLLLKVPTAFIEWSMFHTGVYRTGVAPNTVDTFYDAADVYPGSTYITHIGCDWYDVGPNANSTNYTDWKTVKQGTFQKGLKSWADFARAKGKRFTVSEWGSRPSRFINSDGETQNTSGGGDNPDFVKHMKTATQDPDLADIWDWHSYFRIDSADGTTDESAHSMMYFNGSPPTVDKLVIKTPFRGVKGQTFATNPTHIGGYQVGSLSAEATGNMGPWYRYLFGTGAQPT